MKRTSKRIAASRKRSPRRRRTKSGAPPYERALLAFADLATRLQLRWYVFGAQAVGQYGVPRTTQDLDLTVELAHHPIDKVVRSLETAGFVAKFDDAEFIATTRVLPLIHRASGYPVDLVFAGPGLEELFFDEVVTRMIGDTEIPVISIENLVVTKVLAGRPRDLEDVRELVVDRAEIDHEKIVERLAILEEALGQSDLRPLYARLRR